MFDWTARNSYMYLCVIVIILAYFEKYYMATILNVANIAGIFIGQFLGDYLREKSISDITPNISNQGIAKAYYHHGVEIWIITILVIVVIAFLVQFLQDKT